LYQRGAAVSADGVAGEGVFAVVVVIDGAAVVDGVVVVDGAVVVDGVVVLDGIGVVGDVCGAEAAGSWRSIWNNATPVNAAVPVATTMVAGFGNGAIRGA